MSKRTKEKIGRMFDGEGVSRQALLPAAKPRFKACRVCRRPMPVGKGQEAKYHKECRKYRKRVARVPRSIITPSKTIK